MYFNVWIHDFVLMCVCCFLFFHFRFSSHTCIRTGTYARDSFVYRFHSTCLCIEFAHSCTHTCSMCVDVFHTVHICRPFYAYSVVWCCACIFFSLFLSYVKRIPHELLLLLYSILYCSYECFILSVILHECECTRVCVFVYAFMSIRVVHLFHSFFHFLCSVEITYCRFYST